MGVLVPATDPTIERRCYLHIGTHKTGTTSIQAFLAANRSVLGTRGLLIPQSAGSEDSGFAYHHGIYSQLTGHGGDHRGGLTGVAAELASATARQACLTSENLSLLYDRPALLEQLRSAIVAAGFRPIVVVYLRPQLSYATAIYASNVQSGYRASFAEFLADVFERGRYIWDGGLGPPFDYVELLDAFAASFGRDALVIRRFRSEALDAALLRSFLEIIEPAWSDLRGLTVPPKRANRTLTFAGVLRLLGAPEEIDEHVRFAPFGPGELARFWAHFAPANQRLAQRYGIRLPAFDPLDLGRAFPLRRTPAMTLQLLRARRALRTTVSRPDGRILANERLTSRPK